MTAYPFEDAYIVRGGVPLHGSVRVSGAKNMALKAIIGALLFNHEVILENVPRIVDVISLFQLVESLGGIAEFTGENTAKIDGRGIDIDTIDFLQATKTRVSFMLFAPLLMRLGHCTIPNPGGCRLGARPIDRIVDGMKAIGIDVSYHSETGNYHARKNGKLSGTYHFQKMSHTGTELLILLSVINGGVVTIENAAQEPEIDDLIRFLNESGARVLKEGTTVTIEGVSSLSRNNSFSIPGDRNEAVTFAVMALATKGDVVIEGVDADVLTTFIEKVTKTGAQVQKTKTGALHFSAPNGLTAVSIETAPHPGFMTDWQPSWAIFMTQATGVTEIHERIFENRFAYVAELKRLGADITFIDTVYDASMYEFNGTDGDRYQQKISITGPQSFHNGVLHISDLRAGAVLVTAALLAEGESVIHGAGILRRGYERLTEKIRALGGSIEEV